MYYLLIFHVLKTLDYLIANSLQKYLIKNRPLFLVDADVLVQVHVQVLKDDDDVLPEVETVLERYDTVVTFVVGALVFIYVVELC